MGLSSSRGITLEPILEHARQLVKDAAMKTPNRGHRCIGAVLQWLVRCLVLGVTSTDVAPVELEAQEARFLSSCVAHSAVATEPAFHHPSVLATLSILFVVLLSFKSIYPFTPHSPVGLAVENERTLFSFLFFSSRRLLRVSLPRR
jgi:hypothetical protein